MSKNYSTPHSKHLSHTQPHRRTCAKTARQPGENAEKRRASKFRERAIGRDYSARKSAPLVNFYSLRRLYFARPRKKPRSARRLIAQKPAARNRAPSSRPALQRPPRANIDRGGGGGAGAASPETPAALEPRYTAFCARGVPAR